MSDLLQDMHELLRTNKRFLLGIWQRDAAQWATDVKEKELLEYNARNQITLWGPTGEVSIVLLCFNQRSKKNKQSCFGTLS